jgi:hypothetical protein
MNIRQEEQKEGKTKLEKGQQNHSKRTKKMDEKGCLSICHR